MVGTPLTTFVSISQKCYRVTIDGIVDLISTCKVVGVILPIIDSEIRKINRSLTRLAGEWSRAESTWAHSDRSSLDYLVKSTA